jgi:P-type Cu+ transporter
MLETKTIKIAGMTCALCSLEIERGLLALPGVESASVSYASERAAVRYSPELVSQSELEKSIEALGFYAGDSPSAGGSLPPSERRLRSLRRSLIAAATLSFPLFFMMLISGFKGCHAAFDPGTQTAWGKLSVKLSYDFLFLHDWRFQLALVTPVQFILGWGFYRNAFRALRLRVANMDVLVALGTTASYAYSLYAAIDASWSVYNHPNLYFEAGSTVITLVLLGRYIEALAKRRTSARVGSLARLAPQTGRVVVGEEERELPLSALRAGDELLVRPGESIPVDGIVIRGSSAVDEAMLSGESSPVEKLPGSSVIAGSVNSGAELRVRAEKVGEATRLAGIVRLVEEAQATKAEVQGLVDRVCALFVPAVIGIAAATFFVWFVIVYKASPLLLDLALVRAISVLVVSCPCALGLATPTALVVGMGAAARRGILVKDGRAMERLAAVDLVAFDKTGTLTEGRPSLKLIVPFGRMSGPEALRFAAAAERRSEQPYGRALCDAAIAAHGPLPEVDEFVAYPGRGVGAKLEGRSVLAGSPLFLEERGIALLGTLPDIEGLRAKGMGVVALAVDGSLEALFALEDVLKPDAAAAVLALIGMSIESRLLTGDDPKVARLVASAAGIESVEASLSSEHKAEEIGRLQAEGRKVAMVGDGINDAPALAAADVGIALGGGTDIAIEAGDIIALGCDLLSIPAAIRIARQTSRRIRANLAWAFSYNVVCISLAVLGRISPELAALAMAASSIAVILGSLRIDRKGAATSARRAQPR